MKSNPGVTALDASSPAAAPVSRFVAWNRAPSPCRRQPARAGQPGRGRQPDARQPRAGQARLTGSKEPSCPDYTAAKRGGGDAAAGGRALRGRRPGREPRRAPEAHAGHAAADPEPPPEHAQDVQPRRRGCEGAAAGAEPPAPKHPNGARVGGGGPGAIALAGAAQARPQAAARAGARACLRGQQRARGIADDERRFGSGEPRRNGVAQPAEAAAKVAGAHAQDGPEARLLPGARQPSSQHALCKC